MTFHITKSGSVELVDSYGNGKSERGNWSSTPATLICDDGDGYYDAWKYAVPVPDDFWIEDSSDSWSDVKPNLKKYSNAVAW